MDSLVLFVCTGNICRSPLAAALWKKRYPRLRADSAGLIPRAGRPSPDNVRAAACARGANLVDHRSRTLDETMLRESDVIVLFEPRHFVELRRAFPEHVDKIVMLGALLDPPRVALNDPYQLSTVETEHVAAQIDAALDELALLLGVAPGHAIAAPAPVPSASWSPGP
jgi:protein-tyrosine phosphatase